MGHQAGILADQRLIDHRHHKEHKHAARPPVVVLLCRGDSLVGADDTAGINLATAKYLVEQKGVIAVGSDTSGLEVSPAPDGSDTFIPVHKYLLIEQGVHILEFHNLEELARDKVYEFCYIAATNKIAGSTAGFTMRPIGLK